jgi:hypothetical protein
MKKNHIVIILVIAVILLAAAAYFMTQNKKSMGQQSGVIGAVKDAVDKTTSLQCDYTDDTGRSTKTYIKNGLVRSDSTGKTPEDAGSVILTKEKMYTWQGKLGFMMDIPQVNITPTGTGTKNPLAQKERFMTSVNKYKQYCKQADVSDSLFIPPSDVSFTDYSKMIPPQGENVTPGGVTHEQIKQYMDKLPKGSPQP